MSLGFQSVAGHPCLFKLVKVVKDKEITIIIAVFVDDLIVTGNDNPQIEYIKKRMEERFALTDEGRLEYYLGVELEYKDTNTLVLHQRAFIKKLLARFDLDTCNSKKTPLDVNLNLSLKDCPETIDPVLQHRYRELIGSLMYLYQWTRPDLGFAVTFLSRYLHKPGEKHWEQARNVLRYLKGETPSLLWILVSEKKETQHSLCTFRFRLCWV
jgi:hypothetical protein